MNDEYSFWANINQGRVKLTDGEGHIFDIYDRRQLDHVTHYVKVCVDNNEDAILV